MRSTIKFPATHPETDGLIVGDWNDLNAGDDPATFRRPVMAVLKVKDSRLVGVWPEPVEPLPGQTAATEK
jgi:hypothetical protein